MRAIRHDTELIDSPALWPEGYGGDVPDRIWSTHDACRKLGIDRTTLKRWAIAAGMRVESDWETGGPARDPVDRRITGWTQGELDRLAKLHQRQLLRMPDPDELRGMRELKARVTELERRLDEHLLQHATPPVAIAEPVERPRQQTVKLVRAATDTLPPGWEAPSVWATAHGLPIRTIEQAITRGSVPAPHRGHWKRGQAIIANAWDEEQQAEALRYWQNLGRIPSE